MITASATNTHKIGNVFLHHGRGSLLPHQRGSFATVKKFEHVRDAFCLVMKACHFCYSGTDTETMKVLCTCVCVCVCLFDRLFALQAGKHVFLVPSLIFFWSLISSHSCFCCFLYYTVDFLFVDMRVFVRFIVIQTRFWNYKVAAQMVHFLPKSRRIRSRTHIKTNHDELCFELDTYGKFCNNSNTTKMYRNGLLNLNEFNVSLIPLSRLLTNSNFVSNIFIISYKQEFQSIKVFSFLTVI